APVEQAQRRCQRTPSPAAGGRIEDHQQSPAGIADDLHRPVGCHRLVVHLSNFSNTCVTLRLRGDEYSEKPHNITDFHLSLLLDIDIAALTFTDCRVSDEYDRGGQSLPFDL